MHELAVCQALIAQVAALAHLRRARVSAVHVGLGPLAGVEPALLAEAYPIAAAGTAAENSRLVIEVDEVRVRCRECAAETVATANRLLCGECGAWRTEIVSGDAMLLLRVELQLSEPSHGGQHV